MESLYTGILVSHKPTETELLSLLAAIEECVCAHDSGLREYTLMEILCAKSLPPFDTKHAANSLDLFRRHFIVFHCLYRIRDHWRAQGHADLGINALQIQRLPYSCPRSTSPARMDSLRNYYLDWRNWVNTDAAEVERLLRGFQTRAHANQLRDDALRTLGLTDPVHTAVIKKTYRRLVMRHHPDRGGDTQQLQNLNAAMTVLSAWSSGGD